MSFKFSGAPYPSGLIEDSCLYSVRISSTEYDSRWTAAELRISELLSLIQPNGLSEKQRKAVADYVKGLICRCFDCQVFTFGSVPLKTYLPDGDIDLTAFSRHQNLRDTWANDVQYILKTEERRKGAQFCVRDVQYIQAEVKIVKCLVENIVVDISFGQLGGLCTLCFLEEVDRLIEKDHLFKRSIILIKAWCYYESRLLGAHHGLISTYALETLVLYIFNVFHTTLRGPLEVLFIFLDYFSNFDWEKYCVSLWGPVLLSSLPDLTAEPPLKDGGKLLLSKEFLDSCSNAYAVFPNGQDTQTRTFIEKHLNVVDPLRTNNNLGRSVSKANFFRIRSAFSLGARKMAKIFESTEDDLVKNLDTFFSNTWERHQSGERPDVTALSIPLCVPKGKSLEAITVDTSESAAQLEDQGNTQPTAVKLDLFDVQGDQYQKLIAENSNIESFGGEVTMVSSALSHLQHAPHFSGHFDFEPPSNDDVIDKPVKKTSCIVDGKKKSSSSRTRGLGKGSSEAPKVGIDLRLQMRRTVSVGSLEELSDTQVVKDSRIIGDAQDLAAGDLQTVVSRSEPLSHCHKVTSAVEMAKNHRTFGLPSTLVAYGDAQGMQTLQTHSDVVSSQAPLQKEGLDLDFRTCSSKVWRESGMADHGFMGDQPDVQDAGKIHVNNLTAGAHHVMHAKQKEQISRPHGPPFDVPDHMVLQNSKGFESSSVASLALDSNTAATSAMLASSSSNSGMTLLASPMATQISQGLLPAPVPSYAGVGNVVVPQLMHRTMDALQTAFIFRDPEQMPYFWQPEQEHRHQFAQSWWYNTGSNALLPSPQVANLEINGLGGQTSAEIATMKGDAVAVGGGLKNYNVVPHQGSVMDASTALHDKILEPAQVHWVAGPAMNEITSPPGIPQSLQGPEAFVHGLPVFPSSGEVEVSAFVPSAALHQPVKMASGLNMHNLAHPLPTDSQLLEKIPVTDTVLPPVVELVPLDSPAPDGPFSNQAVHGTQQVYFPAASFSTLPYYNPIYLSPPTSSYGCEVEGGAELGVHVLPEDNIANLAERGVRAPPTFEAAGGKSWFVSDAALNSNYGHELWEVGSEPSRDLLSSDFANHRRNLEFGRWCQDPYLYQMGLSSYLMPKYVQGNIFWDGVHRPLPGPVNASGHIHGSVQKLIPASPPLVQSIGPMGSGVFSGQGIFGAKNTHKHYQIGTGTFLPGRGMYRDAPSGSTRYQAGAHQEPRPSGGMGISRQRSMGHGFNSTDGNHQTRKFVERNAWRKSQQSTPGYSPITPLVANRSSFGPFTGTIMGNLPYEPGAIVTLPPVNLTGRNSALVAGQLEFGSLGPVQVANSSCKLNAVPGMGAVLDSRTNKAGLMDPDAFVSFPDRDIVRATAPKSQQRIITGTYQLREDDFPPLPLQHSQQAGSSVVSNGNNSVFHY